MGSILAGGEKTLAVFPEALRKELRELAELDDSFILTAENYRQYIPRLTGAEYIFSTWGMPALSEQEIKTAFPNLKAVFYAAGSVQYFARPFLNRGIRVFSAWAANAVPVAEYTVAQIVLANAGFFQSTCYHSRGDTERSYPCARLFPGNYGCKVGILGAGQIGTLVIQMLKNYRLQVLVFDPFLSEERAAALGVKKTGLTEIFSECQTISNHLANNEQTVGILNYETCFSHMKDTATFLNTGRGAQVVEEDLVRALREKTNAAAVLDVTFPEPPEQGHPFYTMPNVFLTPHIAGSKGDEVVRMARYMLEEFQRMRQGDPPRYEVTLEMLEHMA